MQITVTLYEWMFTQQLYNMQIEYSNSDLAREWLMYCCPLMALMVALMRVVYYQFANSHRQPRSLHLG